jgi:hypothetical protein
MTIIVCPTPPLVIQGFSPCVEILLMAGMMPPPLTARYIVEQEKGR